MLDIELKFFCDHLPEWLEKHSDRVALVKGAELIGFFDDEQQAIATGARQFGLGPFLVRRVQTEEPPVSACANSGDSACLKYSANRRFTRSILKDATGLSHHQRAWF